jgi:hypothetical protein
MHFESSSHVYDRALCLKNTIHFRQYLGFNCTNFAENLNLSLVMHALQMLRSVTYQGRCTCSTQCIFGSISSCTERISHDISTQHFSLQMLQVLLLLAKHYGHFIGRAMWLFINDLPLVGFSWRVLPPLHTDFFFFFFFIIPQSIAICPRTFSNQVDRLYSDM